MDGDAWEKLGVLRYPDNPLLRPTPAQVEFIEQRRLCTEVAKGFCAASVDGYCIGGYDHDGRLYCHG